MNFNPVHIVGTTLGDTWFQLISALWERGRRGILITDGSFKGSHRMEFDMVSGFCNYPHQRPLAPILPPSIGEVPTNDDKILDYFNEYIMNPKCLPGEEYRYSTWINGQYYNTWTDKMESALEWVIRHFQEKGYGNNHCYIRMGKTFHQADYDAPYSAEMERKTTPCLQGLDFKIKDNCLLIGVIYRSWDLYGGWPENMGGFTLLNEYVCGMLGDVEPGPLAFFSMGLHCYDHQLKAAMKVLNKEE
jgi:thymidylate synthase